MNASHDDDTEDEETFDNSAKRADLSNEFVIYIYIFRSRNCFVLAWAYVYTFFSTRLHAPGNLLSNILFCLPAVRSSDAQ